MENPRRRLADFNERIKAIERQLMAMRRVYNSNLGHVRIQNDTIRCKCREGTGIKKGEVVKLTSPDNILGAPYATLLNEESRDTVLEYGVALQNAPLNYPVAVKVDGIVPLAVGDPNPTGADGYDYYDSPEKIVVGTNLQINYGKAYAEGNSIYDAKWNAFVSLTEHRVTDGYITATFKRAGEAANYYAVITGIHPDSPLVGEGQKIWYKGKIYQDDLSVAIFDYDAGDHDFIIRPQIIANDVNLFDYYYEDYPTYPVVSVKTKLYRDGLGNPVLTPAGAQQNITIYYIQPEVLY